MEQLSLFDTDGGAKAGAYVFYCNDDWSLKTQGKENLCMYYTDWFTKSELKDLCNRAVKWHKRGQYGYSVYFEDDGVKKEYIRPIYQSYCQHQKDSFRAH